MRDKAVVNFLPAVKLVTDWFVRNKMVKKLDGALFINDDMTIFNVVITSHFLVVKWEFLVLVLIK